MRKIPSCPSPRKGIDGVFVPNEVNSEAAMRQLGVPREVRLRMGYVPRRKGS